MRVAFGLIDGIQWTGGKNYLINLLSALAEIPGKPIEPVLFIGQNVGDDLVDKLLPYLAQAPIKSKLWTRNSLSNRMSSLRGILLQRNILAEEAFLEAGIDLVFQMGLMAWSGSRFALPTLAWIPDFQHKHLRETFSTINYWKREIGFRILGNCATQILVSSEDARQDCERFYPFFKNKIAVLPFAVRIVSGKSNDSPNNIREKYHLPDKFFFMPNQFWKHKNHFGVLDALKLNKARKKSIVVVASGTLKSENDPNHPKQVVERVKEYGLENQFRMVGMIPYVDVISLMRESVAVINPSMFEGWSTTVEEAKSLGVPLLLSDLRVHREQNPQDRIFFDPYNAQDIADVLLRTWCDWNPGSRLEKEAKAHQNLKERRMMFAQKFLDIAKGAIRSKNRIIV